MHSITYSEARQHLAQTMQQAADNCEAVLITRNRGEDCVLLSLSHYRSLEETAYLLRSPANARRLAEAAECLRSGGGTVRDLAE